MNLVTIGEQRPTILIHGRQYGLILPAEGTIEDRERILSFTEYWKGMTGDIANANEEQLAMLIQHSRGTVEVLIPEIEPYVLRGLTFVDMMQIWGAWATRFGEPEDIAQALAAVP